jgi:hypothetical protein
MILRTGAGCVRASSRFCNSLNASDGMRSRLASRLGNASPMPRLESEYVSLTEIGYHINATREKLGFRDIWTGRVRSAVEERMLRPRFGFPGILDRAPPPPKTLHWRYAPAEGEYNKIRSMLAWGTVHVWLVHSTVRPRFWFVCDKQFDWFYQMLVNKWLPEASIPSFSIKSEAKLLVDEQKQLFKELREIREYFELFEIISKYQNLSEDRFLDFSFYLNNNLNNLNNSNLIENSKFDWLD